jgi:hypothetical protein
MTATAPLVHDARREGRSPAACKATARLAFALDLKDASHGGVRARCPLPLAVGTTIKIDLPGRIARHARIAWSDGQTVGCEFLSPLSDRELATVLAAAPQVQPFSLMP